MARRVPVTARAAVALQPRLPVTGQPVKPGQQPWLVEQEMPAATLGVEHAEMLGEPLHLGLLTFVDVLAQTLLEGKKEEPAGGQNQHQKGSQKSHKEFFADAHDGGGLAGNERSV